MLSTCQEVFISLITSSGGRILLLLAEMHWRDDAKYPSSPHMHLPSSCPRPWAETEERQVSREGHGDVNFLVETFGNIYERSVSVQLDSDSHLQDQETGQWQNGAGLTTINEVAFLEGCMSKLLMVNWNLWTTPENHWSLLFWGLSLSQVHTPNLNGTGSRRL